MSTAIRNEAGQRGNGPSEVRPQSIRAIRCAINSTGCEGPRGVLFATNIVTPAMLRVGHGAT
ncbi:hypothetical protein [Pseudomonas kurunegalensis]|uniref:hypothetical protein n=1 Tax=Pseudomonas kurunegalensis TaxID=485880 RepID=UPI002363B423|nr:hypothetical protein [Pseudomonas kurunegalensis]MDD2135678.1 hypothetical protein [Pseudomonas kurunegalensis]